MSRCTPQNNYRLKEFADYCPFAQAAVYKDGVKVMRVSCHGCYNQKPTYCICKIYLDYI